MTLCVILWLWLANRHYRSSLSISYYTHQCCIYLIRNEVKQLYCGILWQFIYIYIFKNVPVNKAEFSTSLLQSSVSHLLMCCSIFLINQCLILIFWWMESSKEQYLHETDMFSNFKNGFTVTFDQFNASLLY